MKIVILEPIGLSQERTAQIRADFEALNHELIIYSNRPENDSEILKRAEFADILLLSNLPVPEKVISSCKNLKMISVAFAGVDHLPMDYCRNNNILVCNAAGYSNHAVAELTIGTAIDLYRKIDWNDSQTRELSTREGFLGSELFGKTFGIIGTGQIGSQVAHLATAFGCKVLGYNRTSRNIPNVEFSSLEYLLKHSDIISLHIPLSEDTKHLIHKENLMLVKPTAIFVNTARGPVIDYQALSGALKTNKIAGAAIDVYEKEPPLAKSHPLLNAPNTILLPHIGYATKEAIELRGKIVVDNIRKWIAGEPQNVMN